MGTIRAFQHPVRSSIALPPSTWSATLSGLMFSPQPLMFHQQPQKPTDVRKETTKEQRKNEALTGTNS
jgi:hypothetical protein